MSIEAPPALNSQLAESSLTRLFNANNTIPVVDDDGFLANP